MCHLYLNLMWYSRPVCCMSEYPLIVTFVIWMQCFSNKLFCIVLSPSISCKYEPVQTLGIDSQPWIQSTHYRPIRSNKWSFVIKLNHFYSSSHFFLIPNNYLPYKLHSTASATMLICKLTWVRLTQSLLHYFLLALTGAQEMLMFVCLFVCPSGSSLLSSAVAQR